MGPEERRTSLTVYVGSPAQEGLSVQTLSTDCVRSFSFVTTEQECFFNGRIERGRSRSGGQQENDLNPPSLWTSAETGAACLKRNRKRKHNTLACHPVTDFSSRLLPLLPPSLTVHSTLLLY
ncbi:hypothetical protein BaRGS_00039079 [Batillaria attramentaria]|uniref:Uncharacterized protein n=1 Tax=Batillaria attramentaria TaxID=370345 RepID=A0ABD0J4A7_9CAEN